ncbi:esterase B1-like [Anopheles bellator]|uniref:esterase B1-like n=1 Tax=Anopheles bellator TaxID=139047 RepID=UPI0026499F2B|nr:esterase B1-like [Anopheles bellator]
MVIHKLYVPPKVVKVPSAAPYQPPAGDLPVVVDTSGPSNGDFPVVVDTSGPSNGDFPVVVDTSGPSNGDFPVVVDTSGPSNSDLPVVVDTSGSSNRDFPVVVDTSGPPNGTLPVVANNVVLDLKPGTIVGRQKVLPNGGEYYSYQGIPYAHPPVGELRFRPPVPLERFVEQPLQCGQERDVCLAVTELPPGRKGTEDCLYLNVYTTCGPSDRVGLLKPVMVWIHGGGYLMGSGNTDLYGPDYLLQHDVILVTFNYRLGPLGFLALPSMGIYGNQGLKDQQLALRWVHEHIAEFGGDRSNVTLFGESAGSSSVNWHYLSPVSRQYFHKAICQSGAAISPWLLQTHPDRKTRQLASVLGYTGADDAGVLATLLNAPVEDLVANSTKAFEETDNTLFLVSPFIPAVEDPSSDDPIITARAEDLLKQANTIDIPLMHGVTMVEGLVFYGTLLEKLVFLATNLAQVLPLDLAVPGDALPGVLEEVRQYYFHDQPIGHDTYLQLMDLMSDVGFNFAASAVAELQSRYQQGAPQYFYRFAFDSELNEARKLFAIPDGVPGACHADELSYLFSGSTYTAQVEPDSAEARGREMMCRLWTNFAKFANPTPDDQVGSFGFRWEPVPPSAPGEAFVLPALELCDHAQMIENPFHDRIQFWRSLYDRYNPSLLG